MPIFNFRLVDMEGKTLQRSVVEEADPEAATKRAVAGYTRPEHVGAAYLVIPWEAGEKTTHVYVSPRLQTIIKATQERYPVAFSSGDKPDQKKALSVGRYEWHDDELVVLHHEPVDESAHRFVFPLEDSRFYEISKVIDKKSAPDVKANVKATVAA